MAQSGQYSSYVVISLVPFHSKIQKTLILLLLFFFFSFLSLLLCFAKFLSCHENAFCIIWFVRFIRRYNISFVCDRFNPNLYADGKVCLSLLGTWHAGDATEKWTPGKSSLYQVKLCVCVCMCVCVHACVHLCVHVFVFGVCVDV